MDRDRIRKGHSQRGGRGQRGRVKEDKVRGGNDQKRTGTGAEGHREEHKRKEPERDGQEKR